MARAWMAFLLAAALPGIAGAQEEYRHGRVRYVEPGVTLQRAEEPAAEEAAANVPFLPGDRVWTDDRGRVEFQFGSDSFLRVDSATKLDYLEDAGSLLVVRLWSGALFAHADDEYDFEVQTPAGRIAIRERGAYRVDARGGVVALSVYEGGASLDGERSVSVREGERLVVRDGDAPQVEGFDRAAADDFGMWADSRQESMRYARVRPAELPAASVPFYDELYDHGTWSSNGSLGYVWYPRVAAGWSPYAYGRWAWLPYGWTWIAAEPWGWAPFHYGRWGHSPARGWYWIPRAGWSPAWVAWAVGGPTIGWSPLGYYNRAIHDPYAQVSRGPNGVLRGIDTVGLWRYARANEMTKWNYAGHATRAEAQSQAFKVIESPQAWLTKDLHVADGPRPVATPRTGAVPRGTTPAARSRREAEAARDGRGSGFGEAGETARSRPAAEAPAAAPRRSAEPSSAPLGTDHARARARQAPRETSAPPPAAAAPRATAPPASAPQTRSAEPRPAEPRSAQPRSAEPRSGGSASKPAAGSMSKPAQEPRERSREDKPASGGARRKDGSSQ